MFDVDKLKEALEAEHIVSELKKLDGFELTAISPTDDSIIAAARMVVAGQPLELCLQHGETDDGTSMECRMVEGWWMPTGKDET